jgi:hypothetical protein
MVVLVACATAARHTFDEAVELARAGRVDLDVVEAFKDYSTYYYKTRGRTPTTVAHANGFIVPALIDYFHKSNDYGLLEEAVIRAQTVLADFPQDATALQNLDTAVKLLFGKRRGGSTRGAGVDWDFIEIGTSDYETLNMDSSRVTQRGLSVEPVTYYYKKLQKTRLHQTLQAAVIDDRQAKNLSVFYIDPDILREHPEWPEWVRGVNKMSEVHHTAEGFLRSQNMDPGRCMRNESVRAMPMYDLLASHGACRIGFLKIDTEGMDCPLTLAYLRFLLEQGAECHADAIQIELNENTPRRSQEVVLRYLTLFGYTKAQLQQADVKLFYVAEHDRRRLVTA